MLRADYLAECSKRWSDGPLRNARANWRDFEAMQGDLIEAMRTYRRSGQCHNPEGTLTALLWKMQSAWQPDPSCLHPFLDFCDHYQTIFLRRGLVVYCAMLLRHLGAGGDDAEAGCEPKTERFAMR